MPHPRALLGLAVVLAALATPTTAQAAGCSATLRFPDQSRSVLLTNTNVSCSTRRAVSRSYLKRVRASDCQGSGCFASFRTRGARWGCISPSAAGFKASGRYFSCESAGGRKFAATRGD